MYKSKGYENNAEVIDELLDNIFNSEEIKEIQSITNVSSYFMNNIYNNILNIDTKDIINSKSKFPSKSINYFSHLITGGGGSIFKYNNMVFKLVANNQNYENEESIKEVVIPQYINEFFLLNQELTEMRYFIMVPTYVRYGNLENIFNTLNILHKIYLMIYLTVNRKFKITLDSLNLTNSIIIDKNKNIIMENKRVNILTQMITLSKGIKIYLGNNFNSLVRAISIIKSNSLKNGYLVTFPLAINSSNKLCEELIKDYYEDGVNLTTCMKNLSLQIIFQVLLFYYVILVKKPNFAHKDLKLDNILIKALPSRKISFNLMVKSELRKIEINSPFTFVINDFERSELNSVDRVWSQDIYFLFKSIEYYNNLLLPREIVKLFKYPNNINSWIIPKEKIEFTYNQLENLILDKSYFSQFINV